MVRFILMGQGVRPEIVKESQFHCGSIHTSVEEKLDDEQIAASQFHYGSIHTNCQIFKMSITDRSQFHYGSIHT